MLVLSVKCKCFCFEEKLIYWNLKFDIKFGYRLRGKSRIRVPSFLHRFSQRKGLENHLLAAGCCNFTVFSFLFRMKCYNIFLFCTGDQVFKFVNYEIVRCRWILELIYFTDRVCDSRWYISTAGGIFEKKKSADWMKICCSATKL